MRRGGVFRGKIRVFAVWLIGPLYAGMTKPILLLRMLTRRLLTWKVEKVSREASTLRGLDRCRIVYINLASRPDRKSEVENEFRQLRVRNFERFEAIARDQGIIGCNLSHATALRQDLNPGELVMICEDDVEFLVSREEIDELIESFFWKGWIDVLSLGNNIVGSKAIGIDKDFAVSNNIQTVSCYVVRRRHVALLASIFSRSAKKLEGGGPVWLHALDIAWKSAQRWRLVFAVPRKRVVIQRPSFSDIEKERVHYSW